jgi:hypothetical protein
MGCEEGGRVMGREEGESNGESHGLTRKRGNDCNTGH